MTNQSQYDELWDNQKKYQKIIEIIKAGEFRFERITPYEVMRAGTMYDICIAICEINDTICDIWEVINHDA